MRDGAVVEIENIRSGDVAFNKVNEDGRVDGCVPSGLLKGKRFTVRASRNARWRLQSVAIRRPRDLLTRRHGRTSSIFDLHRFLCGEHTRERQNNPSSRAGYRSTGKAG